MSEEKAQKIQFNVKDYEDELKDVKVSFGGTSFLVKKVIDFQKQQNIIMLYLTNLFEDDSRLEKPFSKYLSINRFFAEFGVRMAVLKEMTNLEMDSIPEEVLFNDEFFDAVISHISNWDSFVDVLHKTAEDAIREREAKKSLGYVLDMGLQKFTEVVKNLDPELLKNVAFEIAKVGDTIK